MASRRLEDLHPDILPLAARFIRDCRAVGIDILIYCTFRPQAEQEALYARGRTEPGPKVTWTLASKHSFMLDGIPAAKAFDWVPVIHGKLAWDDLKAFGKCGAIATKIGLTWGGTWKAKDSPHCEI